MSKHVGWKKAAVGVAAGVGTTMIGGEAAGSCRGGVGWSLAKLLCAELSQCQQEATHFLQKMKVARTQQLCGR